MQLCWDLVMVFVVRPVVVHLPIPTLSLYNPGLSATSQPVMWQYTYCLKFLFFLFLFRLTPHDFWNGRRVFPKPAPWRGLERITYRKQQCHWHSVVHAVAYFRRVAHFCTITIETRAAGVGRLLDVRGARLQRRESSVLYSRRLFWTG
jgi:hypothetical protein